MTERDAYEVLQVQPDAHALVIQAAYRALASLYHPDRDPSPVATHRMAELNIAFARVRTPELRDLYDRARGQVARHATVVAVRVEPEAPAPARPDLITFGRYSGWTIGELARHDPDYLRWLSRHSSGIRYRSRIEAVLAPNGRPHPATRTPPR
ncbi:MAG: DnaJ domain-containing protein [Chloroflexi bacterium]|nr:DnaJ domain-containing protein [Chloroflexota bacterium]